jgi:DNA-directed RNA polymerase specialized sigma24 family protein
MKSRNYVDYTQVLPEHDAIHERLRNWARWCKAGNAGWAMHPMWRHLEEKERRENPVVAIPVDTLDGHLMEKAVFQLPEKHRHAIRWSYVFNHNPLGACKQIAVSKERLAELVRESRSMLNNRLNK